MVTEIGVGLMMIVAAEVQPTSLECVKVDWPMTLDGQLKETVWKEAKPISHDGLTVMGVVKEGNLWLGVEVQEASPMLTGSPAKPQDDPRIKEGGHIEVTITDRNRKLYYRVLLTSAGEVYDVKQRLDENGAWQNDLGWSSQAKVNRDVSGKRWSAECSIPLTAGAIQFSRKGADASHEQAPWYTLQMIEVSEAAARDLTKLTEVELIALANQQAQNPTVIQAANLSLDLMEGMFEIMADDKATPEAGRARMAELINKAMAGNLMDAKESASVEEHLSDNMDEMSQQMEQIKPLMNVMAPMIKKQSDLDRSMVNAASLPVFLNHLSERYDEKTLKKLPGPGASSGISLNIQGLGMGRLPSSPARKLPKSWAELTDDQFQDLKKERLRPFTAAGRELIKRQLLQAKEGEPVPNEGR